MTRSGVPVSTAWIAPFRGLDRLDLKLGMQRELFDQRLTQVGVIVHDQQSPRLGHLPYFIDRNARPLAQDCGKRTADAGGRSRAGAAQEAPGDGPAPRSGRNGTPN